MIGVEPNWNSFEKKIIRFAIQLIRKVKINSKFVRFDLNPPLRYYDDIDKLLIGPPFTFCRKVQHAES